MGGGVRDGVSTGVPDIPTGPLQAPRVSRSTRRGHLPHSFRSLLAIPTILHDSKMTRRSDVNQGLVDTSIIWFSRLMFSVGSNVQIFEFQSIFRHGGRLCRSREACPTIQMIILPSESALDASVPAVLLRIGYPRGGYWPSLRHPSTTTHLVGDTGYPCSLNLRGVRLEWRYV